MRVRFPSPAPHADRVWRPWPCPAEPRPLLPPRSYRLGDHRFEPRLPDPHRLHAAWAGGALGRRHEQRGGSLVQRAAGQRRGQLRGQAGRADGTVALAPGATITARTPAAAGPGTPVRLAGRLSRWPRRSGRPGTPPHRRPADAALARLAAPMLGHPPTSRRVACPRSIPAYSQRETSGAAAAICGRVGRLWTVTSAREQHLAGSPQQSITGLFQFPSGGRLEVVGSHPRHVP
jgi:hypothetical protein